jgi:hypothetical protein
MLAEGNNQCWERKLPSMPSDKQNVYHPNDFVNILREHIQGTGMIVVGGWVRKWKYGDGITL